MLRRGIAIFGLIALSSATRAVAAEGDAPSETIGWRVSAKAPEGAKPGSPAVVAVTITVLPGHYIYRERTKVALAKSVKGATLAGVDFPQTKTHFDKFQNADVEVYEDGDHVFPAKVTVDAAGSATIAFDVKSQACTHEFCLFPTTQTATVTFVVAAPKATPAPTTKAEISPAAIMTATAALARATVTASPTPLAMLVSATATPRATIAPAAASTSSFSALGDEKQMTELIRLHFGLALLLAFVGGLAISLTPCVYPMIPITVAIIGAQSGSSRSRGFFLSLIYVAGIAIVYSLLGMVAALGGHEFGFMLQSPWVRLGITVVFLALASSMFGAFEIALPAGLATRLSTWQGSGLAGVFITGLFSGIVAGPCTAPVLLGILVAIGSGVVGVAGGSLLMLSFSLGMGVLFVVIGTFSGALASLPRSGAWMVRVKHVFGFLLIGGALYYAKLVIPEWAFDLALAATLAFAGVHLGAGATIREEDGEWARFGKALGMVAIAAGLTFAVGGVASSGYVPSLSGLAGSSKTATTAMHGPEIPWLTSEAEGLARARATHKPMLIDFWADWCLDCKELDASTYTDPRVIKAAESFVPVKLDTSENLSTTDAEKAEIDRLKKKYSLPGLPRIFFVTPEGIPLDDLSLTGNVSPETILERMQRACTTVAC